MNPFTAIYNFIKNELINKYPELGECYMFDDEEDDRYKEYYIKYKGKLSFQEIKVLYYNIIKDICDFCEKNEYQYELEHSAILINRSI